MKKLMVAVGAVLAGAMAMASTPASFAYQGVLRDDVGKTIGGSSAKITFRLYNDPTAEGSALWFQTQTLSLDTNGLFNAELGDPTNGLAAVIAKSEADGMPLYIGLTVDGSAGEIRPRQKLIAAPLAAFAQDVRETKGDLTINGTAYFNGPVSMKTSTDTLTCGNIDAKGTLTATGKATFNAGAQVGGDMTVSGAASVETLTVEQKVTVKNGDIELDSGKTVKANGVNIGVPIGCILMWSGDESNIPDGWALCDGGTYNNKKTPDLRGRFIVGVNREVTGVTKANSNLSIYSPKTTGGEERHTLSTSEMPTHRHIYIGDGIYKEKDSLFSAHSNLGWHTLPLQSGSFLGYCNLDDGGGDSQRAMITGNAGGGAGDGSDWDAPGEVGRSEAHENRPPYYALCFIMKVK